MFPFLALVLFTFQLTGCSPASSSPVAISSLAVSVPSLTIVAIDRSGSTEAMRPRMRAFLAGVLEQSADYNEAFGLWVVDRKSAPAFEPRVMTSNTIPHEAAREIATPKGDRAFRTRPLLFWQQMAEQYGGSTTKTDAVRIAYLTDGDNDWAAETKAIRKAVEELGKNPRVVVALIGLNKDQIDDWQAIFTSFGPNRVLYRGAEMCEATELWALPLK